MPVSKGSSELQEPAYTSKEESNQDDPYEEVELEPEYFAYLITLAERELI